MAMNKEYYDLAYAYVMGKGMGEVEADNIATTLAVLIPMRRTTAQEEKEHGWPNNSHVVECIEKLHQGQPYQFIIPYDLGIQVIVVESVDDLPATTTYGQCYHIREANLFMETKPNGITELRSPRLTLQVTEPLGVDPDQLARLRETAAQHGLTVEVWNKDVDHPDNVIGLAKMKALFAGTAASGEQAQDKLETAELQQQRAENQSSWSKPTGKINFRTRHASNITRMRNNKRRG